MTDTVTEAQPPTREDVEDLKKDWSADPCWDIEETEGFESYHDELLAYRLQADEEAAKHRHERLLKRAQALGCPGNTDLANYIETLEYRLERLEEKVAGK